MFKERRLDPRERLALRLRLRDGATAVTRDISGGGLFFLVDGTQVLRGRVDFEMQMPEISLRFTSSGEIVRVEYEGGTTGVAVRFVDPRLDVLPQARQHDNDQSSGVGELKTEMEWASEVARRSREGSE